MTHRESCRSINDLGRLILCAVVASAGCAASATTTTLFPSPNPSTRGQPVTLTATVSPTSATGKVTFYDGMNFLGVSALSAGQAVLTTTQLPSGTRSLTARYDGDAGNASSLSAVVAQTVNAVAGGAFAPPVFAPSNPNSVPVVADFNGDGKMDLATGTCVLLGNGDGTFQAPLNYAGGSGGNSVGVGDFNGDGKADVAVFGYYGLFILLGNGEGTFQAPAQVSSVPGSQYQGSIAVGDFNADRYMSTSLRHPEA